MEADSLCEVEVRAEAYWGAQTQRSLAYFAIASERLQVEFIHAYARVKRAAAQANAALGELSKQRADCIARAAEEVIEGQLDHAFPLRVCPLAELGAALRTRRDPHPRE